MLGNEESIKQQFIDFIHGLQNHLCAAIEQVDGAAIFKEDVWQRAEGGGGITRIIANGAVFEKGGVNTSIVFGDVTDNMRKQLKIEGEKWFACGISSVLHPINPMVPTVHFNYRYFELYDAQHEVIDSWFGGGTDLTPYYLFEDDVVHFHQSYQTICNQFHVDLYPQFKHHCDTYFVNKHRNNECRGVGGIFYDYQRNGNFNMTAADWLSFAKACGYIFETSYLTIATKHKDDTFTDAQKYWQQIRRGRYVEFNLVHDRGTLFGLHTNGRTESILMSLPPTVRFDYEYHPPKDSAEAALQAILLQPKNWLQL
ncbi:oxygen-dependent coproporphyrinogen oxidase [Ferruginibacter yonginensis]|uniref:coproporphyrinogen oxidase n=1 Tax=Ferruginibacter yonginensis TaxID=1310416 RepID=A0ABV8QQ51_9BACT